MANSEIEPRMDVQDEPDRIRIYVEVPRPVPSPLARAIITERSAMGASHSQDYASVKWRGHQYTFTKKQRTVIAALFQAAEDGHDFLSGDELLEVAESDQRRLRNLFLDHPAWGVMIVPGHEHGGRLGTFRIAP